jgi:hypothetical protein
MLMTTSRRPHLRRFAAAALALAAFAPPQRADAQVNNYPRNLPWQPHLGIGYTANIPNQFVGVSAHAVTDLLGGMGLYVDAKFATESPEDKEWYEPDLTSAEVIAAGGDAELSSQGAWRSVNVALMRGLSSQLTVYGGAGYVNGTQYVEYYDAERQLGRAGVYWVRDEEESGTHVNFLGGVFFQVARTLAIQLGGESKPGGFTVGVSYLIPLNR